MKSRVFVAAVGAFVGALVALIGYLTGWPAEVYPLAMGVVGAALAVWRAFPSDESGRADWSVLGVLAVVALLGLLWQAALGCSTLTVRAERSVRWEVSRSTCAIVVEADGRRVFELVPTGAVQCRVDVKE
ncbi:MAG: hypothetical protein PVJ64_00335 [Gemmatimonadales bacterium]|jgi:hypothetical protein